MAMGLTFLKSKVGFLPRMAELQGSVKPSPRGAPVRATALIGKEWGPGLGACARVP